MNGEEVGGYGGGGGVVVDWGVLPAFEVKT